MKLVMTAFWVLLMVFDVHADGRIEVQETFNLPLRMTLQLRNPQYVIELLNGEMFLESSDASPRNALHVVQENVRVTIIDGTHVRITLPTAFRFVFRNINLPMMAERGRLDTFEIKVSERDVELLRALSRQNYVTYYPHSESSVQELRALGSNAELSRSFAERIELAPQLFFYELSGLIFHMFLDDPIKGVTPKINTFRFLFETTVPETLRVPDKFTGISFLSEHINTLYPADSEIMREYRAILERVEAHRALTAHLPSVERARERRGGVLPVRMAPSELTGQVFTFPSRCMRLFTTSN